MVSVAAGGTGYRRDRVTWLAFAALAVYGYVLYALGPMLTLLRHDLDLQFALIGVHSTVFAAGVLVPGLFLSPLIALLGRARLLWLASAAVVAGALALAAGRSPAVTLPAVAVLGLGGVFLQILSLSTLADRHGAHRDRALVEANVGASLAAVLSPLLVGLIDLAGADWRLSLALPVVALAALYLVFRDEPLTTGTPVSAPADGPRGRPPLPVRFWAWCAVCGLLVGAEFCVVYFGASLLSKATGVTAGPATLLMTAFAAGELAGRLLGSRLTARPGRAAALLLTALSISAAAITAVYLAHTAVAFVAALLLLGVGMGNLFPLALSLAVATVPGRSDDATARTQLVVGGGIMLAPLALGALADRIGVEAAFGTVAVLLVAATLLIVSLRVPRAGRPVEERTGRA